MKLRQDLVQGSQAWLNWRAEKFPDGGPRIMASDVPTIMGVSPYETAHQLWMRLTGRVGPKPTNFAMQRGHKYEPIARALLEQQTGLKIEPVCVEATEGDLAPLWAGCSLDGRAESGQIFEIKVPGKASFEDVALRSTCPAKWFPQV